MPGQLTSVELQDLRRAKSLLENQSLALKLSNLFGAPIDAGFALLPKNWSRIIGQTAESALFKALAVAVATTSKRTPKSKSNRWHKMLAGVSGGVGGAFGLASLPVELPVSTTLILRSIVDIARSQGHDQRDPATKLACLEVFALGGAAKGGGNKSAYWATRMALSQSLTEAASYLAQKGTVEHSAPALVRFVASVASRFGVVVSEEVAAKALPVIGAVGGGVVNVLFMHHFQNVAEGHFTMLRLEKSHGVEAVKAAYDGLIL